MSGQIQKPALQDIDSVSGMEANSGIQSSYLNEYFLLLGTQEEQQSEAQLLQDINRLQQQRINFDQGEFTDMKVEILNHTENYEIIIFLIKYGHFRAQLSLINVDSKSPRINLNQSFAGNFGGVSKLICSKGAPAALKGVPIKKQSFEFTLMECLKECLLVHIAAALKVGPWRSQIFGFDLVAFRDEIVFCMEFCEEVKTITQQDQVQIKQKLKKLHRLGIVHMDIKPDNLALCPRNLSPVFIDFGLSRVVKQRLGEKTLSNFIGSINYCCKEMIDLYIRQIDGYVDLYYNDAACLSKSIIHMQVIKQEASNGLNLMAYNPGILEFMQCMFILRAKYIFYLLCYDNSHIYPALLKQGRSSAQKYPVIYEFIQGLSQSSNSISYFQNNFKDYRQTKFISGINLFKAKRFTSNDLFDARMEAVTRINSFSPLFQSSRETQLKIIHDSNRPEPIEALTVMRIIKLGASTNSFQQKVKVCRRFTTIQGESTSLYKETVRSIFLASLSNLQIEAHFEALINSIQTVVALEIVSEENFQAAFTKCYQSNLRVIQKIRVLFQFISSLQIIKQKYNKTYRYDYLKYSFLSNFSLLVRKFIPSNDGQSQIRELLNFIMIQAFQKKINLLFKKNKDKLQIYSEKNSENLQLFKSLQIYYYILNITKQIDRYLSYDFMDLQTLKLLLNKKPSLYTTLMISTIYYVTHQHLLLSSIYSRFLSQLSQFQQHKYYKIFFVNKLSNLKKQLLYTDKYLQRYSNGQPAVKNRTNTEIKSLFSILSFIITQNINEFYHYARFVFILNAEILCLIIKPYLIQFFDSYERQLLQNIESIQDQSIDCLHDLLPVLKISILNNMLQYCYQGAISKQKQLYQLKVLAIVNRLTNSRRCPECHLHLLIECNNYIANYIPNFQYAFFARLSLALQIFKLKEFQVWTFQLLIVLNRIMIKDKKTSDKYQLQPLLNDYCLHTKRYALLLTSVRELNLFINVYQYIANNLQTRYLVQFVYNTGRSNMIRHSEQLIFKFYINIKEIIKINQKNNSQYFHQYHNEVIYYIINYETSKTNYLIPIYLYCFLSTQHQSMFQKIIILRIAIQLDFLDNYPKSIIFNHYYEYFCYFFQLEGRRKYCLTLKHAKNTTIKRSLKKIVKDKLKQKGRYLLSKILYNKFSQCIKNYHTNLDNIL